MESSQPLFCPPYPYTQYIFSPVNTFSFTISTQIFFSAVSHPLSTVSTQKEYIFFAIIHLFVYWFHTHHIHILQAVIFLSTISTHTRNVHLFFSSQHHKEVLLSLLSSFFATLGYSHSFKTITKLKLILEDYLKGIHVQKQKFLLFDNLLITNWTSRLEDIQRIIYTRAVTILGFVKVFLLN